MSLSSGLTRVVANVEHLFENLAHCAQRVELAPPDLVEEPPELGIVGHSMLQVLLCPRGGDGEPLPGEVLGPPLLELTRVGEVRAVRLELLPELGDVFAPRRLGEDDRRAPLALL